MARILDESSDKDNDFDVEKAIPALSLRDSETSTSRESAGQPYRPPHLRRGLSTPKKVGQACTRKGRSEAGQATKNPQKKKLTSVTKEQFYSQLTSCYLLTEDQLRKNGYPRPTSEKGVASIRHVGRAFAKVEVIGPDSKMHKCCRCGESFVIYEDGHQSMEACIYHPNKAYTPRDSLIARHGCCQKRSGSPGCQTAKLHVTDGEDLGKQSGYVQTTPSRKASPYPGVYALDCEMCYTVVGLRLTRVSVIDMDLKPVYETLVKPSQPIVDFNTRFSGLREEDFVDVETDLAEVHEHLLSMFSSDTILIGHSLESDLEALKLLHSRVVDTSVVFPHPRGLPYKKALRTLARDILHKLIQKFRTTGEGHDSLEDAQACMELMLLKVESKIT